jgi:hypothetical protein
VDVTKLKSSKAHVYLGYLGLPVSWKLTESLEEEMLTPKFKLVESIFTKSVIGQEGKGLFVQNRGELALYSLLNNSVDFAEVKGIDFAEYFAETVNYSDKPPDQPKNRYVIIYNIGNESANNPAYPAKILTALIYNIVKKQGNWAIVVSSSSYTEFNGKYGIAIANKIRNPPLPNPSF